MEKVKIKISDLDKPNNENKVKEVLSVIFEKTNKNHKPLSKEKLFQYIRSGYRNCLLVSKNYNKEIEGFTFIINERAFAGITPDPINLYFEIVNTYLEAALRIEEQIFTKHTNDPLGITGIEENDFKNYLQSKISCIIMLYSTLDAFINSLIPDDAIFPNIKKELGNHAPSLLHKEEIEAIALNFKVRKVASYFTRVDMLKMPQRLFFNLFRLIELRNKLVHLQPITIGKKESIPNALGEVLEADLEKFASDVKTYINIINQAK